jgi:hypothetical protein
MGEVEVQVVTVVVAVEVVIKVVAAVVEVEVVIEVVAAVVGSALLILDNLFHYLFIVAESPYEFSIKSIE